MVTRRPQIDRSREMDVHSYQQFWENVEPDVLRRHAGKRVALHCGEKGWEIIGAADNLDQLQEFLAHSGTDLTGVVFDQVHLEEETAPGLELQ